MADCKTFLVTTIAHPSYHKQAGGKSQPVLRFQDCFWSTLYSSVEPVKLDHLGVCPLTVDHFVHKWFKQLIRFVCFRTPSFAQKLSVLLCHKQINRFGLDRYLH